MKENLTKNPLRGLNVPNVRQQPEHERLKQDPKLPREFSQERGQLATDFKRSKPANLPAVGRNQEHAWNDPKLTNQSAKLEKLKTSKFYDEETYSEPVDDELSPVFGEFGEEDLEETSAPKKGKVMVESRQTVSQKEEKNSENNYSYYIFYKNEILEKSNDLSFIKQTIEALLLANESLKVEELVLMKRLKISTGIIIE